MTTTPQEATSDHAAAAGTTTPRGTDRGLAARKHLWKHFTRESAYGEGHEVPIIVRGEGAYVFDDRGRRYLDGLAGLFVVQAGHGRRVLAEAAAKQAADLAFFPLWSYAHPAAIDLAERLAHLAPGDLNRVFFTTGGGEAVESAWKLAKQYFKLSGKPGKTKVISRSVAYHGTTAGALSITGIPSAKAAYEPLVPGAFRVPNTTPTERPTWSPATRRRSGAGPRTASRRRSSSRAPTRWRRCSSSRCRTRAAASRRRPATSSGCARSATSTTCCWCRTR